MSVLTGPEIEERREQAIRFRRYYPDRELEPGMILIDPWIPENVGSNSVDVRLSDELLVYRPAPMAVPFHHPIDARLLGVSSVLLDSRSDNPSQRIPLSGGGYWLTPGILYLGSTIESTESPGLLPVIDGRSSVGRLGIRVHATAGRGDDGFRGRWTLEIDVVHPVKVYPGDKIAQITFQTLTGKRRPYKGRYQDQPGPVPSRFHQG